MGTFGLVLALAALTGCSGSQSLQPQSANDVFTAMSAELSHAMVRTDPIDEMDDALSHTIGETRITSATLVAAPIPAAKVEAPTVEVAALQTWGSSAPESRD